MSRQIIKKDNGKFAVWSTIVDDFIADDIMLKEYVSFRITEEIKRISEEVGEIFAVV